MARWRGIIAPITTIAPMSIIAPHLDRSSVRNLFHDIDLDGNGIIDLDEFLLGIDEDNLFGDISESE